MNTSDNFASYMAKNNPEISILQTSNKPKVGIQCLSFWASDSSLAFEYFHTRLGYDLIQTSQDHQGTCSMCFAPYDDETLQFHIHFNHLEEHTRLLDNDSEYLERPRPFLKLVPVISSDPGGCIYMNYGEYE